MGEFVKKEEQTKSDEIFSKVIRAGKRTYFFDVKSTRNNDFYLTLTESKKRIEADGKFRYEKHKIFLYREDFDKFAEGLEEVIGYIKENLSFEENIVEEKSFSNIDFDDLNK